MRKIYILLIILTPLFLGSWYSVSKISNKTTNIIEYKLENKSYKLLVADTPEKWGKGLMYIRRNPTSSSPSLGASGMIFIFPKKEYRTFWNKNTYLDLDVYWLSDDKIIGKDQLSSIEKSKNIVTVKSPGKVNKVIEIIR